MTSPQVASESESPRFTVGVQALVAINVAIYYLQIVGIAGPLKRTFGFTTALAYGHWWTIVTYMFVHGGFFHLLANMYALYLFGPRLEHAWGTKRFVRFYFFCAFVGLLTHAAFIHDGSTLIGASAPVFGVMTAYAMLWPTDEVFLFGFIPMRVWTLVWTLIGVNLGVGLYSGGLAPDGLHFAYIAHLGGAIGGWAYMRTPGTPTLEQLRQRVSRVPDAEEPPRPIPRSQPRGRDRDETDDVVARSRALLARRTSSRTSGAKSEDSRREELNRVLDKISALGIESLSPDERRTLEEMARQLRDS
jgi:membrane associated rhomboid family serine protease